MIEKDVASMGKSEISPHTFFGMLDSGDVAFSARPRWNDNTKIDHVETSRQIVNEVLRSDFELSVFLKAFSS
jgi:hypothetical protein